MCQLCEHCWRDIFIRWWEPEEEWFWRFESFLKLKTAFCEYWTSIKTKFSMICVSKEFEIKTKMVLEQWLQLERSFLFFCWVEFTFGFWRRGNKNLVGRRPEMKKLLACKGWRDSPPPPYPASRKNPIYIYIYIYYTYTYIKELCQQVFIYNEEALCTLYTSCAKVVILLMQDLSTLCVTDIYGIYFPLSIQCS